MKSRCSSNIRGFTLVEVTIIVTILALTAGVILPSLAMVGVSELFSTAGKLTGTIRASYDAAALSGNPHRLVFDFGANQIRVEAKGSSLEFGKLGSAIAAVEKKIENEERSGRNKNPAPYLGDIDLDAEIEALGDFGTSDDEDDANPGAGFAEALLSMGAQLGAGQGHFVATGQGVPLSEDILLESVWMPGMREPATSGEIELHFFQGGYASDAIIHLKAADSKKIVSIRLHGLSGRVELESGYMEAPSS